MTSPEIGYFGFTDGGCINNGKKNAKASFCSISIDGTNKYIIDGLVQPNKYYLDEAEIVFDENGKIINISTTDTPYIKIDNAIKINPSSNRGELLGLVHCFAQLVCMGLNKDMSNNYIEVYTDSLLCVNTFNKWLLTRQKNNTTHKMKNIDLITIADIFFKQLKLMYKSAKLLHIKSHQPKPDPSKGTKELFIWLGNKQADEHCSLVLK
jgi:ribonuclease HI